ncbi:MAG: hypothetical protein AAGJ40_24655 [Planctomycetota bacterium]
MANDLEEFLKRAAALRQQKAVEQRAAEAQRDQRQRDRVRPYTDRRTERQPQWQHDHDDDPWDADQFDEPVIMAEVVSPDAREPVHSSLHGEMPSESREQRRGQDRSSSSQSLPHNEAASSVGDAGTLIRLLRQPGGIRQAFLMREILNRPNF